MSRLVFFCYLTAAIATIATGQSPPKFDVVSVRPCKPNEGDGLMRPAPGGQRYVANCVPLKSIIWVSYLTLPDQVMGGPDWVNKEDYYVEGAATQPSTLAELKVMMQSAIADRFQLRLHWETRELDAYVLGVDKNGPRNLKEHAPPNGSDVVIDQQRNGLPEKWTAKSAPMTFFVWRLGLKLGRPVIDQTGLRAAGYDFELSFTNELPPSPPGTLPPNLDTSWPTIFQALRTQLGLKLDSKKGPVDVLVIDHVERPSEN
jgi:uncharacterized protein (TIGR03435 family)